MIYLPSDNVYDKCYVVQNEGVIRGYDRTPANNTNYNYRDYYIRSDYIYKDGNGTWSQYTTLPICIDDNIITNDFYYRLDFTNILINVLIIVMLCFYPGFKLFKCLFGRRLL